MELPTLLGGGIKSVQTGYLDAQPVYGAAVSEDGIYCDVTIAAVTMTKSVLQFVGQVKLHTTGDMSNELLNPDLFRYYNTNFAFFNARARLINATTLRIATRVEQGVAGFNMASCRVIGRWTVVEGK